MTKLITLLSALACALRARAEVCFSTNQFPKWADLDSYTHAVTYSEKLDAVFSGGFSAAEQKPWMMRIDADTSTVRWRKYSDNPNPDKVVFAAAVNPEGTKVAFVGSDGTGVTVWAETQLHIWIIRASDGGYLQKRARYIQKQPHFITSEGLVFTSSGKLYIAARQKDSRDDSNYGKPLVLAYDVNAAQMDWAHEQPNWRGLSAVLAYRNYCPTCANIFVGGNTENGDDKWRLSITRLTEQGLSPPDSLFALNQEKWHSENSKAPFIDHMHLDDTSDSGSEWMFGSSRSRDELVAGDFTYLWKVKLDGNHNPDGTTVTISHLGGDMRENNHIIGIKPTLVSGKIHGLYWRHERQIYYFSYDWSSSQIFSIDIEHDVDFAAVVAFGHPSRSFVESLHSQTIYQGFWGASMQKYDKKSPGPEDFGLFAGLVGSTIMYGDSCLKDRNDDKVISFGNLEDSLTIRTSPTWQTNTINGSGQVSHSYVTYYDFPQSSIIDDTWCSPKDKTVTIESGDASAQKFCLGYDDTYNSIDFTPPITKTGGNVCTDPTSNWVYEIDQAPISANDENKFLKVSIDSLNNKIWASGVSGGTVNGFWTMTVNAFLPLTRQSSTFQFQLTVSACKNLPLIEPVFVNQFYALTNPVFEYDAPPFATDPACEDQLIVHTNSVVYTSSVSVNPFILDNEGVGKKVGWETSDELDIGLYTITISATTSCQAGSLEYTLTVQSVCKVQQLPIDSSNTVFTSPALTQSIWEPEKSVFWSDTDVTPDPNHSCGSYVWQLVMTDGSPIDTTVFRLNDASDPRELFVFTIDPIKATTYQFTIKVTLFDHPENPGASKDFSVLIENRCETSNDIIAAAAPTDQTYLVSRPALNTDPHADFEGNLASDPSFNWFNQCPWTYQSSISPVLVAPDNLAIIYDATTMMHATFTDNIAIAGVYTITVSLLRPSGAPSTFSFSHTITIVNPCESATFTIDPTILPIPYEYVINQPADTQVLLDTAVTSSETIATCPDIILQVLNRDASPIDASIFTYTLATQQLVTETSDQTKKLIYPMTVFAQYDGPGYTTAGQRDFEIDVIDPCLNDATLTAQPQTNPIDYLYTGDSPKAQFTMNPFVIDPVGYCTVQYSCAIVSGPSAFDLCSINNGLLTNGLFDSVTGNWEFESFDQKEVILPGTYTLKITGKVGSTIETVQFSITLVNPCANFVTITQLLPIHFQNEQKDLGSAETIQSWDFVNLVTTDAWVDCGSLQVNFYLNDASQTPLDPLILQDDRAGGLPYKFTSLQTYDQSHIGVYDISYSIFYEDYPANLIESSESFLMEILQACPVADSFSASAPQDQEYTLTDNSLIYQIPAFSAAPSFCSVNYELKIFDSFGVELPCATCFVNATRTFTFHHDSDLSLSGPTSQTYTVQIVGETGTDPAQTKQVQASFTLLIKNPCIDPNFVQINSLALTDQIYDLYDFDPVGFQWIHPEFVLVTNPISHTLCGGFTYGATFMNIVIDMTTDPMKYDTLTRTYTFYSEDFGLIGSQPFTLETQLTDYPVTKTVAQVESALLTIGDPCPDPDSVNAGISQMTVADYIYTGDSPKAVFTMNPFVSDPPVCTVTYSCSMLVSSPRTDLCSIIDGSTIGAFDPLTGDYSFQSTDLASYPKGLYQFEITGTVGTKSDKIIVNINLNDPCATAVITLEPSPLKDVTHVLRDSAKSQSWLQSQLFKIATEVDCGPISVDFYNAADINSSLDVTLFDDQRNTLTTNHFTVLMTQDVTKDGIYPISYRTYYTNYPTNFVDNLSAFTVTIIDPCDNPVSVTASNPIDQVYTITQTQFDYQVPTYVADPVWCAITYSFLISDVLADKSLKFDDTTQTFTFEQLDDLFLSGPVSTNYTITVTGVAGNVNEVSDSSSFTLSLLNPCIDPTYVTIVKQPLPTGLFYALYDFSPIPTGYKFSHDTFITSTSPFNHTLCGEIHYEMHLEGDLLSFNSNPMAYDTLTRQFEIYSEDMSLLGFRRIEARAYLKDYSTLVSLEPHLSTLIEIQHPCLRPLSISSPTQTSPPDYAYTKQGTSFSPLPMIIDPPICNVTYECIQVEGDDPDMSCLADELVFESAQGETYFQSFDMGKYTPGSYKFTLRATMGTQIPISTDFTFNLTLVDPCPSQALQNLERFPFIDMRYTLGKSALQQEFQISKLISVDTFADCGEIMLQFINGQGLPLDEQIFSVLQSQGNSAKFQVNSQKDKKTAGEYKIRYRAYLKDYPEAKEAILADPFRITIVEPPSQSDYIFNVAPDWLDYLQDQYVMIGDSLIYNMGEKTNMFGGPVDVKLDLRKIDHFASYDPISHQMVALGNQMTLQDVGIHKVKVEVSYSDPRGKPQYFTNSFYLHITSDPNSSFLPQDDQNSEQTEEGLMSLDDWDGLLYLVAQQEDARRPVPYISNFTPTGVMTIAWDRQMLPVEKPARIPVSKVAVNPDLIEGFNTTSTQSDRGRRLSQTELSLKEILLRDTERDQILRMILLDALQVQLREDPDSDKLADVLDFTWDILSFDENFIILDIKFRNPQEISFQSKDYITVTFWGVEFFKSFQGFEVEIGTQLDWKIQRMMTKRQASEIEDIQAVVTVLTFTTLMGVMIFVGLGGRLLPTFMFLNSMQLIVHTPLLATYMPGNLHLFFLKYLDMLRLKVHLFDEALENSESDHGMENYELSIDEQSFYTTLINDCGYKFAFSRNMVIILFFATLFVCCIAGLAIYAFVSQCRKGLHWRQMSSHHFRHAAWMSNFTLRYAYQFFFEICLCVLINTVSPHDQGNFLWVLSLIFLLAVVALVGFSVSLFFKGGPYVQNSFAPNSLMQSYWSKRPLNNADQQTKEKAVIDEPIIESDKGLTNKNLLQVEQQQPIDEHVALELGTERSCVFNDLEAFNKSMAVPSNTHQLRPKSTLDRDDLHQVQNYEGGKLETKVAKKTANRVRKNEIRDEALQRVELQELVRVPPSYRTLFYGLKRNHEHNVGPVHLITFILRRVLFSIVIVFMAEETSSVMCGIFLLMSTSLFMLAILLVDGQWEDFLINHQHLSNEILFYLLCCALVCFCGLITDADQNWQVGNLVIMAIFTLVIYNLVVIVYDLVRFATQLTKRYYIRTPRKIRATLETLQLCCSRKHKVESTSKTKDDVVQIIEEKEESFEARKSLELNISKISKEHSCQPEKSQENIQPNPEQNSMSGVDKLLLGVDVPKSVRISGSFAQSVMSVDHDDILDALNQVNQNKLVETEQEQSSSLIIKSEKSPQLPLYNDKDDDFDEDLDDSQSSSDDPTEQANPAFRESDNHSPLQQQQSVTNSDEKRSNADKPVRPFFTRPVDLFKMGSLETTDQDQMTEYVLKQHIFVTQDRLAKTPAPQQSSQKRLYEDENSQDKDQIDERNQIFGSDFGPLTRNFISNSNSKFYKSELKKEELLPEESDNFIDLKKQKDRSRSRHMARVSQFNAKTQMVSKGGFVDNEDTVLRERRSVEPRSGGGNNLFKASRGISRTPAGNALFPQSRTADDGDQLDGVLRNWAYISSTPNHKGQQNEDTRNWRSILAQSKSIRGAAGELEPSEIARSVHRHNQRLRQIDVSASYSTESLGESVKVGLKSFSPSISNEKAQRSKSLMRNGRQMITRKGRDDLSRF